MAPERLLLQSKGEEQYLRSDLVALLWPFKSEEEFKSALERLARAAEELKLAPARLAKVQEELKSEPERTLGSQEELLKGRQERSARPRRAATPLQR